MCDKIRQMQATIRQEERARAAIMENMLKKEAEERIMEAREEERAKAREQEKAKAEQQRNAYLKLMIENHIPLEKICTILQMSVETVIQQAYLLGCVL